MSTQSGRRGRVVVHVMLALAVVGTSLPVDASNWGARREFREGAREIARERREMRRDILNSGSRVEARQAYREGMREIGRERREMRREIGRELRYGGWDGDRDRGGAVVAGVVVGAVIAAAVRGAAPPAPAPGLCWYWSDHYQERGYWDRCGGY